MTSKADQSLPATLPVFVELDGERQALRSAARQGPKYVVRDSVGVVVDPAVIVDSRNRILVWHLPNIVCREREVRRSLIAFLKRAHVPLPQATVTKGIAENSGLRKILERNVPRTKSWRTECFEVKAGNRLGFGLADLSPGWFQQAHDVRRIAKHFLRTRVSANLPETRGRPTCVWRYEVGCIRLIPNRSIRR
jgi:hypothetical protein